MQTSKRCPLDSSTVKLLNYEAAAALRSNQFNMARTMVLVLGILAALSSSTFFLETNALDPNYYSHTCPQAAAIVKATVLKYVLQNKNKAAQLLRLHFHDCWIRGSDGSVLIKRSDGTAEADGLPNINSLGGYEVIDDIKKQLEAVCPRTVSCADVVALAARDGVCSLSPGVSWTVYLGRKDGNISIASETLQLPAPFNNCTELIANFASRNLNIQQMVALSGGHTIGTANCTIDQSRLYNFSGRGDTDPTMDPGFASFVKAECPSGIMTKRVAMKDDISPPYSFFSSNNTFDNVYYVNVNQHKGFFQSDEALVQCNLTKPYVDLYRNNAPKFIADFGAAMIAMGNFAVKETGYVRRNCSVAFS